MSGAETRTVDLQITRQCLSRLRHEAVIPFSINLNLTKMPTALQQKYFCIKAKTSFALNTFSYYFSFQKQSHGAVFGLKK